MDFVLMYTMRQKQRMLLPAERAIGSTQFGEPPASVATGGGRGGGGRLGGSGGGVVMMAM